MDELCHPLMVKNFISIFLASFFTTALILVGSGMSQPDDAGILYAFNIVPVMEIVPDVSEGTFTIVYLPQIMIIFTVIVLIFTLISFIVNKNKSEN